MSDETDTSAASDANARSAKEDAAAEKTTNKDGSSPHRESENNATGFPAEAAGCPEGLKLRYCSNQSALVSGIEFPIKIAKVRQSMHCQAVFVFFAVDVHFHQMPGKPFAGSLCLGTVCKSAVDAERAVNG
jgi:hypothetical protein